jgi:hypothetical protein
MARKPDHSRRETAEHYTKMIRHTLQTPAWAALSTVAQAIYPFLKLEWRGPKANNNGRIRLSVRQAAARIGTGINTAARGFRDLQAKGFIVVTQMGALGVEGEARGPSYELTELAMPGSDRPEGRKLYRDWRPGGDHEVIMHNANNPTGHNGKRRSPSSNPRRSYPQNRDVSAKPVTRKKTGSHQNGDVPPVPESGSVAKMRTSLVTIPIAENGVPDLSVMAGLNLCPMLARRLH